MEKGMKQCPHCKQEIKAVAVKCRHCGVWFDDHRIKPKSTQDPSKLKGEKSRKIIVWTFSILAAYMMLCTILLILEIDSPISIPLKKLIEVLG